MLDFRMPVGADLPPGEITGVQRAIAKEASDLAKRVDDFNSELARLSTHYCGVVESVGGEEFQRQYEEIRAQRVRVLAELRDRLDGSEQAADKFHRARTEVVSRTRQIMSERGIDLYQLADAQKAYSEQVEALVSRVFGVEERRVDGSETS